MDPATQRLLIAVAAELGRAQRELERLGAALAGDPGVLRAHFRALQSCDRMAQTQGELALLLAQVAQDGADPAAAARLDEVRVRLAAA